jgi:hypothetical protein
VTFLGEVSVLLLLGVLGPSGGNLLGLLFLAPVVVLAAGLVYYVRASGRLGRLADRYAPLAGAEFWLEQTFWARF